MASAKLAHELCSDQFPINQHAHDDIRAQYPNLLQDARDSMRNLMWHQNQKALSDFVIAILDEPHRPCWPSSS